jgi:predicted component of type VI protein secretion system
MKLLVSLLIFLLMHSGCASSEQHAKKGDKTDLSTDEADDTNGNSDKKTNFSPFYHLRKVGN